MGTEVIIDPDGTKSATVVNTSGLNSQLVFEAMGSQAPEYAAMSNWLSNTKRGGGGLLERDRYVTPDSVFAQMQVAQDAAENDDVVSGVLESTESMAFGRMGFAAQDEDEEDIWEQIADDIDLDSRIREMWREMFTVSQFYAAVWWGTKTYKVQGYTKKGTKRKKTYSNLRVPFGITLLDPLKVVPTGNMMFNKEELCYIASPSENERFSEIFDNRADDTMVRQLITGKYAVQDRQERMLLANMGADPDRLWVLNPDNVWRHTATRAQYRRFADVRLKSVFEILDLKHQLREMDRATLLGATNFIVLIKKGSDLLPGRQEEIDALNSSVRMLARVPVIVGDHRLEIEIITPKTDHTLDPERYKLLNGMLADRLYQTFITNTSATKDDSTKLARIIARGMESRRQMLRQALEKNVLVPCYEKNVDLTDPPRLQFHPNQIALDFDPAYASYLLDLHQMGDVSRETMLNTIDLDQEDEARNRKREKDNGLDDIFETAVPFDSPANKSAPGTQKPAGPADSPSGGGAANKTAGRTGGGTRKGGGAAPGTGQGQSKGTK